MSLPSSIAMSTIALDEILELSDRHIRVAKVIRADEPYLAGHYPNRPIFPGVFILEMIDLATRYYVIHQFDGGAQVRGVHVGSIRFLSPLKPNDRFEVLCRYTHDRAQHTLHTTSECVRGAGTRVALARLTFELLESREEQNSVCCASKIL
jgi:3-hydroxyacyl-[acyl-carrier-protein] dehydratase